MDGAHIVKEASTETDDILLALDDDIVSALDPSAPNLSLISHLSLISFDESADKLNAAVNFDEPKLKLEAEAKTNLNNKEESQSVTCDTTSEKTRPSECSNPKQDLPVKKMILQRIREESII